MIPLRFCSRKKARGMIEDGKDGCLLQVTAFHAIRSRADSNRYFWKNSVQFGAREYILRPERPACGDQLIDCGGDCILVVIEMFSSRGGLYRWRWRRRRSFAKVKHSVLTTDLRIQKLALDACVGS